MTGINANEQEDCLTSSPLWGGNIDYNHEPDWEELESNFKKLSREEQKTSICYKWSSGRSILHWALYYKANDELIELLVAIGGKDAVLAESNSGWTPFHVACEQNASPQIMELLFDNGAKENLTLLSNNTGDRERTTPFHLACNHASIDIVQLFIKAGKSTKVPILDACDDRFNTPLHAICRRNNPSPDFIQLIFDERGLDKALTKDFLVRDYDCPSPVDGCILDNPPQIGGDIPLEYLYRNLASVETILLIHEKYYNYFRNNPDIPIPCDIEDVMLRNDSWIYSIDKFEEIKYFSSRFLHMVLNRKFMSPVYLIVLLTDVYMQMLIVALISFVPMCNDESVCNRTIFKIFLGVALSYVSVRVLLELTTTTCNVSVLKLKNWSDLFQIAMLGWTISFLFTEQDHYTPQGMKVIAITSGTVWFTLIQMCAYFASSITIFMVTLRQIILKLVPFLITAGTIGLAFAHMFFITSKYGAHCDSCVASNPMTLPCSDNVNECGCSETPSVWPCPRNLPDTYSAVFRMFLKNDVELDVFADWKHHDAIFVKWISYAYAFMVSILLLTVLIAVVTGVFDEVTEMGAKEFWYNRYGYIVTKKAILKHLQLLEIPRDDHIKNQGTSISHLSDSRKHFFPRRLKFSSFNVESFNKYQSDLSGEEFCFFQWWFKNDAIDYKSRIEFFWYRSEVQDIIFPGLVFEKVVCNFSLDGEDTIIRGLLRMFLFFVYTPCVLIMFAGLFVIGLVTFGLLWPQWMKERLIYGPVLSDSDISNKTGISIEDEEATIKILAGILKDVIKK